MASPCWWGLRREGCECEQEWRGAVVETWRGRCGRRTMGTPWSEVRPPPVPLGGTVRGEGPSRDVPRLVGLRRELCACMYGAVQFSRHGAAGVARVLGWNGRKTRGTRGLGVGLGITGIHFWFCYLALSLCIVLCEGVGKWRGGGVMWVLLRFLYVYRCFCKGSWF